MKRWWDHSTAFGWLCYESAVARKESVACGMKHAYFTTSAPGRFDGRRATKGTLLFKSGAD